VAVAPDQPSIESRQPRSAAGQQPLPTAPDTLSLLLSLLSLLFLLSLLLSSSSYLPPPIFLLALLLALLEATLMPTRHAQVACPTHRVSHSAL
jgi:hypothetical protein